MPAITGQKATNLLIGPGKLRASHHFVARLAAMGLRNTAIASQTGYSLSRISQLIRSPAFEELIARYRSEIDAAFKDNLDAYFELARSNMIAAERQIADRLDEADEAGETLPIRDLISISRDAADRFGYGKKKEITHNVNADFAARLEKAIKRSTEAKVIDITPLPEGPSGQQSVSSEHSSLKTTRSAVGPSGPFRRRA
jgi:hypothetical protein